MFDVERCLSRPEMMVCMSKEHDKKLEKAWWRKMMSHLLSHSTGLLPQLLLDNARHSTSCDLTELHLPLLDPYHCLVVIPCLHA